MIYYDEVLEMARNLRTGTSEQKDAIVKSIGNLDSEGITNLMKESRQILFENTGDDEVTRNITRLMEYCTVDMSTRIINNGFQSIVNFIKK